MADFQGEGEEMAAVPADDAPPSPPPTIMMIDKKRGSEEVGSHSRWTKETVEGKGWDWEVYRNLPTDLQDEIINQHHGQTMTGNGAATTTSTANGTYRQDGIGNSRSNGRGGRKAQMGMDCFLRKKSGNR